MPSKQTLTTNLPKEPPKLVEDNVFDFLLSQSKEKFYFPTSDEVANQFKFSRSRYHKILKTLTEAGRIEQIDRYNFRIPIQFFK